VTALGELVDRALGTALAVVCNHRGEPPPSDFPWHVPGPAALTEHLAREAGVAFHVHARHRGQDPWLFLDLRVGRRLVGQLANGRSVLNLFAYTCGVGVAAAVAGARVVTNVDFAASALAVGQRNAATNGVADDRFRTLHSDCIPVLRQLAGLPVQRRGRRVPFVPVAPQPFDLVFLDPPRLAKGPFGAVDVLRDYPSLFKPCLVTLADGGLVLATNHLPEVTPATFRELLVRCASKAGRPLRSIEVLGPDADFPAFDGTPPFKLAVCRV
jgi:23S rRNA (cytosine1962-C5)-methyltransferase